MATKTLRGKSITYMVELDIDDVRKAGGVPEAIKKWSEESDSVASGVVGQEFSTSGPGTGWSKQHGPEEWSREAFNGGALYYIDESDGRLRAAEDAEGEEATDDNDVYTDIGGGSYRVGDWSDESVVRLACPDIEDASRYQDIAAEMAKAVWDCHDAASDREAWGELVKAISDLHHTFHEYGLSPTDFGVDD